MVAIPLDIVSALLIMKLAAFGTMKENIAKQFAIFRDKHIWSMTALYCIVTFGSFIGFSMALPLSITVIFGISHVPDAAGVMQHTLKNPNTRRHLPTHGWGRSSVPRSASPVAGYRTRGWIHRHPGDSAMMVVASVAVGYVMMQAYGSAKPEDDFPMFLGLFLLLFAASGIGNGSTFRTIGVIFDRQQAGPVLGWTSQSPAYGAFIARW